MKRLRTVSYAASFGDATFSSQEKKTLAERLQNFKMIGVRENTMIDFVRRNVSVPVKRVIDPTLLLTPNDYEKITSPRLIQAKYILLYSRRYNKEMDEFADRLAEKYGYQIVETSLRMTNSYKHKMFYEAGVEDFLSLTKYAEIVITNSYHGAIFAIQMQRPFYVFCREQANTKIPQMLNWLGLSGRLYSSSTEMSDEVNYRSANEKLKKLRSSSLRFLKSELVEAKS
jgi:exopolysaccharide biosynthesis predicted pyruvyltransferase EpsI